MITFWIILHTLWKGLLLLYSVLCYISDLVVSNSVIKLGGSSLLSCFSQMKQHRLSEVFNFLSDLKTSGMAFISATSVSIFR